MASPLPGAWNAANFLQIKQVQPPSGPAATGQHQGVGPAQQQGSTTAHEGQAPPGGAPEANPSQPSALPSFLQGVQVPWLVGEASQDHVMTLCFLIGAIHLTIAHAWNILALAPDTKALAQLGWIGLVWSMYLFALNMVLAAPLPGFFLPLLIASLLLILLFMTPLSKMKKEWIHHAMFPLSIINCFVDVVSYIRLFAVGLASLSVAQSFNDMAMQLGWQKIWTLPIMALILLAGHGLNIILCALGILVHGVRLNTLEFSLHKELEWKGIPYQPFARKERSIAD